MRAFLLEYISRSTLFHFEIVFGVLFIIMMLLLVFDPKAQVLRPKFTPPPRKKWYMAGFILMAVLVCVTEFLFSILFTQH